MQELEQKFVDVLERRGWSIISYTEDGRVELEWFTPAGEDFLVCVETDDFPSKMYEYYLEFDPDSHIEMWVEAKANGGSGIPSIRVLVHDAEEIEAELKQLACEL